MEIDSVDRSSRIVNLAPSHEQGGLLVILEKLVQRKEP